MDGVRSRSAFSAPMVVRAESAITEAATRETGETGTPVGGTRCSARGRDGGTKAAAAETGKAFGLMLEAEAEADAEAPA